MDLPNLESIDWKQAIKLAGNKKDLACDIFKAFKENLLIEIEKIDALYAAKDFAALWSVVHKLHGAVCYCGLPKFRFVIKQIDADLRLSSTENLGDLLSELRKEAQTLYSTPALIS